jgi:hypothetical protein
MAKNGYKDPKTQAEQASLRGSGKIKETSPGVKKMSGQRPITEYEKVTAKVENAANTRKARTWRPIGSDKVVSKADTSPEPHTVPQVGLGTGKGYNDPTGKKLAGSKGYDKVG